MGALNIRFVAWIVVAPAIAAVPCHAEFAEPADAASAGVACEDLAGLAFAHTDITIAERVAPGAFVAPEPPAFGPPGDYSGLPAFCRVAGSIRPAEGSDIRFELWLPAGGWNGRFLQTGNGAAAGAIVYPSLIEPLADGYAVTNTDTGHRGPGGDYGWAEGAPDRLIDYQYRAVHELTVTGKAITTAHYGRAPEKSYWMGCSTGGRQGLLEAQRYPADYDAIVAGAPANNWLPLMLLSVHIQNNLGPGRLGVDKLGLLKEAAISACDAGDGVVDRVISMPEACDFDPGQLQCAGETGDSCLDAAEVAAARRIYAGVVDSDGRTVMPGTGPGSEPYWAFYASPTFRLGTSWFRSVVTGEPDWDPATLDVDADLERAERIDRGATTAMDPDLSAFAARGGKLILYHGTTDGLIPYGNSVNYFRAIAATTGAPVADSVRFFLVPGMDHCFGGEGPFVVDWRGAMEAWAEEGRAPDRLAAAHPDMLPGPPGAPPRASTPYTRPLCPYPSRAQYRDGDEAAAASFECVSP